MSYITPSLRRFLEADGYHSDREWKELAACTRRLTRNANRPPDNSPHHDDDVNVALLSAALLAMIRG